MIRDLKAIRDRRWAQAPKGYCGHETFKSSNVGHTMQHWLVHQMWNELLVHEISQAYAAGSAERNPADTWYQGEATNYQGDVVRHVRLKYCMSMVKVPCVSIYVMRLTI
jgi:hypothetical protein